VFVFVGEPVPDPEGGGASFVLGLMVVRCASMTQALALSQRLRAALSLARRAGRPQPKTGITGEIEEWIDELMQQSFSHDKRGSTLPRQHDCEPPEHPKHGSISDFG
jgi:hypothetical protein